MNCMLFKQIVALNLLLLFSGNIGFRLWSRFFHSNQKKSLLLMNRCEKCHKDRPSAWMSTSSIDTPEEVFHRCDIEGEKFDIPLKIVSFNILAPIYKRLKEIPKSAINDSRSSDIFLLPKVSKQAGALPPRVYEAQYEDLYLERNEKICDQLLSTDADIICLQEFWTGSPSLIQLYLNKLCHNGKYSMKLLERTSHWRSRKDGLAVFIKNDNIQIEDVREILFHDVGDRVALMMLLSILPNKIKQHLPASVKVKQREHFILPHRFICVNMHLIAPHNEYTAKIRIREVAKVLGYIRDKELMDSAAMKNDVSPSSPVCSRTYADYKLPIIISGDMNCGPGGKAYSFVKSQNYKSACENCILHSTYTPSISNNITILSPASSSAAAAVSNGGKNQQNYDEMMSSSSSSSSNTPSPTSGPGWVSHHTHLDTNVFVDHIFYLNPSEQTSLLTPPDWTNVVYQELMERIRIKFQNKTLREVFDYFDHDKTNTIDRKGFMIAIEQLGFSGEDSAALTKEEVEVLLKATDVNNDGYINYKELYDRFWIANEELKRRNEIQQQQQQNRFDNSTILSVPPQVECDDFDQPVLEPREVSSFARTNFLAINGSQDNATIADLLQPYQHQLKKLAEAVPLGDLQVANLTITPKILEHGEWPSDYQLSDHGMLECVFNAEVRI